MANLKSKATQGLPGWLWDRSAPVMAASDSGHCYTAYSSGVATGASSQVGAHQDYSRSTTSAIDKYYTAADEFGSSIEDDDTTCNYYRHATGQSSAQSPPSYEYQIQEQADRLGPISSTPAMGYW